MLALEFLTLMELIGVASAGSAIIFGFYFAFRTRKQQSDQLILSELLILPALIGIGLIVASWIALTALVPQASVAISAQDPSAVHAYIRSLLPFKFFALVLMMISIVMNFSIWRKNQRINPQKLELFFLSLAIPLFLYTILPILSQFGGLYVADFLCALGVMFSFGVMLCIAHLYVYTFHKTGAHAEFVHVYPVFWKPLYFGLALLVLHQLLYSSPGDTFRMEFFAEILFGIIVIGTAFGGGPILQKLQVSKTLNIQLPMIRRLLTSARVSIVMTFCIFLAQKMLSYFSLTFSEYMVMYIAFIVMSMMLGNVLQDLFLTKGITLKSRL